MERGTCRITCRKCWTLSVYRNAVLPDRRDSLSALFTDEKSSSSGPKWPSATHSDIARSFKRRGNPPVHRARQGAGGRKWCTGVASLRSQSPTSRDVGYVSEFSRKRGPLEREGESRIRRPEARSGPSFCRRPPAQTEARKRIQPKLPRLTPHLRPLGAGLGRQT